MMRIYKFGGASIKDPSALGGIMGILAGASDLVIVVSAIGKTTNKLEQLVDAFYANREDKTALFEDIKSFHYQYVTAAFGDSAAAVQNKLNVYFDELSNLISLIPSSDYDTVYDSIVSYGEMLSTCIFCEYLNDNGLAARFVDIRPHLKTDSNHRDAKINWEMSAETIPATFQPRGQVFVTQGFIGSAANGEVTTLGREGSDYSASGLAYLLNAQDVTIWKDVPGIMNADPAWYHEAAKIDELSYAEAIELAFYGAKVIHPKTIKPIENKNIPLFVKSFLQPQNTGTVIKELNYKLTLPPVYILKTNQILISISPKDFSFIVEENISKIFGAFARYKIKVNITQNSAISYSACIDGDNRNLYPLIKELQRDFTVKYNTGVELLTIRYYDEAAVGKMTAGKKILVEQRSRLTVRFVMKNKKSSLLSAI